MSETHRREEFWEPGSGVRSIGPFHRYPLTVNGWTVPNVQVYDRGADDGQITFVLDNRLAIDLPVEEAGKVASWVADVVAVSMGYPCHPRESTDPGVEPDPPTQSPPWRQMVGLTADEWDDLSDDEATE